MFLIAEKGIRGAIFHSLFIEMQKLVHEIL